MALPKVERGQIWLIDLTPQTHKEEPGKRERPCLVVQTDILNGAGHPTTIVIPGTTQIYRDELGDGFPLRVPVGMLQKPGGKPEETDLLIDLTRAISNNRFMGDQPIATLARSYMRRVEEALQTVLGIARG